MKYHPISQINACRWIKQHFHGNSWKFVKDLDLNPCFDMYCSLSTPLLHYRVVSFKRNYASSKGKSGKSLLPGKKWCCHRGACGYFTGNICALGSREAVQGGFICIVAVQCCFSQALSTSLCHKLRYLKTEKKQKHHQLKLTGWPLLIQQCLQTVDGVRERHLIHSLFTALWTSLLLLSDLSTELKLSSNLVCIKTNGINLSHH